jgi:hypothetical protein
VEYFTFLHWAPSFRFFSMFSNTFR